jgi:signal transduction histidine kinase
MMADKLSGQAQVAPPEDAATLAARFADAEQPAWLWDPRRNRIVWGNAAAVRFWQSGSALDLVEYRFLPESPEARLGNGLRGGDEREAVLAPDGSALRARVRADDAALFDGSEGVLVRIIETLEATADPALERRATAFDAAPVALLTIDITGAIIEANTAARAFADDLTADALAAIALQALTRGTANRTLETDAGLHLRLVAMRMESAEQPHIILRIDDVTDRIRLEAALAQRPARAAKAEPKPQPPAAPPPLTHDKDLVASLSHEMRNPLNAILGFTEIMQQRRFGPLGNHRYEGYVDDIHMSAAHLLELVSDLLDLGKLAEGHFKVDFEAVSLAAIVGECTRMLKLQADQLGVKLDIAVPSSLPPVVADNRAMRQLVLNVLSNAIKFTPSDGEVAVSGHMTNDGGVLLKITDTGVGMTEEELSRAMQPYSQVDNLLQRQRRGTGLGLPLAKALAEANKCDFRIRSTPHGGTQVELSFSPARVLAG